MKKILTYPFFQTLLAFLAACYIKFIFLTSRITYINHAYLKALEDTNKPFIMAFWHGRMLMMPCFKSKHHALSVVISTHRDGELIARVTRFFNIHLIRGSSKKDAMPALKKILIELRKGNSVAITPDGPRGPRMRVGGNVIGIAEKLHVPILPLSYAASRCKFLSTWDRFMLPLPFGKIFCMFAEPMYVTREERYSSSALTKLEDSLNTLCYKVDTLANITPVQPSN